MPSTDPLPLFERFPAEDRERQRVAGERIREWMLTHPGVEFTTAQLAAIGGCAPTSASARWREIAREWEGVRRRVSKGLFVYSLTGARRPPGASEARGPVAELRRELSELRATVERLEKAMGGGR